MVNTCPCPAFSLASQALRWESLSPESHHSTSPINSLSMGGNWSSLKGSELTGSISRKTDLPVGKAIHQVSWYCWEIPNSKVLEERAVSATKSTWLRAKQCLPPYVFPFLFIFIDNSQSCFHPYAYIFLHRFFYTMFFFYIPIKCLLPSAMSNSVRPSGEAGKPFPLSAWPHSSSVSKWEDVLR